MRDSSDEPDRADRAYRDLLERRDRHAAPVSDAQFDRLLADFRALGAPSGVPPSAGDATAGAEAVHAAAERLVGACLQLAGINAQAGWSEEAARLAARLEPLACRLQLALHRGARDAMVVAVVQNQPVALPIAEVMDVMDEEEARLLAEREALPCHPGAEWWSGSEGLPGDRLWLLVAAGDRRAVVGIDAWRDIRPAALRGLSGVWEGARGLRGSAAVEGMGLAWVPDLVVALEQSTTRPWTS